MTQRYPSGTGARPSSKNGPATPSHTSSHSLAHAASGAPLGHPGAAGMHRPWSAAQRHAPPITNGLSVRTAEQQESTDHSSAPLPRWRPEGTRSLPGSRVDAPHSLQVAGLVRGEAQVLRESARHFPLRLGELVQIVHREEAVAYGEQAALHWDARWGFVPGLSARPQVPHIVIANRALQLALSSEFVTMQIPLQGRTRPAGIRELSEIRLPRATEMRAATHPLSSWSAAREGTAQARGWRELTRRVLVRMLLEASHLPPDPTNPDGLIGLDLTLTAQDLVRYAPAIASWTPGPRQGEFHTIERADAREWVETLLFEDLILEGGQPIT